MAPHCRSSYGDDLADDERPAEHAKPQASNLGWHDGAERAQHEHAGRLHQDAHVPEHFIRMLETLQIQDRELRLRAGSQVAAHRRPRVGGNDLEPLFDQLSANERSWLPFGGEEHDVREVSGGCRRLNGPGRAARRPSPWTRVYHCGARLLSVRHCWKGVASLDKGLDMSHPVAVSTVGRRLAIWLVGSAVGVGILAWPDTGPRVVSFSEDHGPSFVDAIGILVLVAAWLPLASLLWTRRSLLRSPSGRVWAAAALAAIALLVVTIGFDLGASWIAAVVLLVAVQLCAVWLTTIR
jgi:hypothetical protein